MTDVIRYSNWFEALGRPIPDGNRAAAVSFLVDICHLDAWVARSIIQRVADLVEVDNPKAALRRLRRVLPRDETGVIRACAVLCCPPPDTQETAS